jgi:hypothetical protein
MSDHHFLGYLRDAGLVVVLPVLTKGQRRHRPTTAGVTL